MNRQDAKDTKDRRAKGEEREEIGRTEPDEVQA